MQFSGILKIPTLPKIEVLQKREYPISFKKLANEPVLNNSPEIYAT